MLPNTTSLWARGMPSAPEWNWEMVAIPAPPRIAWEAIARSTPVVGRWK